MTKIENFINENLNEFSDLSCTEFCIYSSDEFDDEVIDYLKENYRFDFVHYIHIK
jgi:hypothetical protein